MLESKSFPVETLFAGRYLVLARRGSWEFVERRGATGVVGLVALTHDRRLLLVEQFRPPLQRHVIELPAGLAGDISSEPTESLVTAARRELLEETGYQAGDIRLLSEGPSSAGLTDEMITFFLMTDLTKVADGGGDAAEQIVVHEVPLTELPGWLEDRRSAGLGIDPKIYAGLFWVWHLGLWPAVVR